MINLGRKSYFIYPSRLDIDGYMNSDFFHYSTVSFKIKISDTANGKSSSLYLMICVPEHINWF